MSGATLLPPKAHNTPYGQEVKDVLHLVITMLEVETLLTVCRNM